MLIGLTGYAGSGKDTVAEILVREHGFKRYAFADKLRELVYAQNPWVFDGCIYWRLQSLVDFKGWDWAKRNVSQVREMLQETGVWVRENLSQHSWVYAVSEQYAEDWTATNGRARVVVTDVRFDNEADWIESEYGSLWYINRPGIGPANGHVSEQLEKLKARATWKLQNDSDLEGLRKQIADASGWFE